MHQLIARTTRRLLALGLLCSAGMAAAAGPLPSIAVLDFELIDEQHDLAPATVEYERLPALTALMERELDARGLYRVVDTAPARELIHADVRSQNLRNCNGCELDIGRRLGSDYVLLGWVQKVSNLILNINARIQDSATGATVWQKSVDIRSNTDESWRRGLLYLIRDLDRAPG